MKKISIIGVLAAFMLALGISGAMAADFEL